MPPDGVAYLPTWQNFYVIIGTAAATLTGLRFVATTLVAGIESHASTLNAGMSAFTTPTIVHFCVVLLMAGILSMPWQAFSSICILLGLVGLGMVLYMIIVMRRMQHVSQYQTPLKDWRGIWHLLLRCKSFSS